MADLLKRRWAPPFCYLFWRKAVLESGGWDERLRCNQDFGFALRVALAGALFKHVPGVVGCYRHHAGGRVSMSNGVDRAKSTEIILREAERALESKQGLTKVTREALAGYYLVIAKRVFGADRALFRSYLADMGRLCPEFKPPGVLYRLLVGALGYEKAEGLLERGRRLRRILDVSRG